jgi:chromosome segregation ATPase
MSERIDQIIQEIHLKFQIAKEEIALLKNEKNDLLNKIEILKNDNEALSNALSSKDEFMKSLHSEIEDLKINLNQPNQQSTNHDQLIEEIVKEIDDCISLLKK